MVDAADNTVPQEAVLGELEAAGAVAAVRWAVVIGEDAAAPPNSPGDCRQFDRQASIQRVSLSAFNV